MFDLKNKVIVITGATGVLASSLAISLAKNNARLVLLGRNQKLLDELTKKINQYTVVENYTADVLKKSDLEKVCKKVVKSFDRIDVLVNAVGGNLPGAVIPDSKSIFDLSENDFDEVVDLNLKSPFFLTQQLTSLLEKKGTSENPSRVVNIASIDGLHVPFMETYSYTASKSGIIHLTRHLAKTLVSKNIIVNAIAPGPFDSHMLGKAVNFDYSLIADSVPRKRIGTPEDIAGLCIYLCSRAGAYTVGETITCDGGSIKTL